MILLCGSITAFVSAALCAVLLRPSGFVARESAPAEPAVERA